MNFAMSMCPTGCPVRNGIQFRIRSEHCLDIQWRATSPAINSDFHAMQAVYLRGRRYIRRIDSTAGIDFYVSSGYPALGALTANSTNSVTIAATSWRNSYDANDVVLREETDTESGTALFYPFKNASNRWGFFKNGIDNTYRYIDLNLGSYQIGIYQIIQFDATTNTYVLHYNGLSGSPVANSQSGNNTTVFRAKVGWNGLPIKEIICYNRGLSAAERGYLHAYQKYDGGF